MAAEVVELSNTICKFLCSRTRNLKYLIGFANKTINPGWCTLSVDQGFFAKPIK